MLLDNIDRSELVQMATLLGMMRTEVPKTLALSVAQDLAEQISPTFLYGDDKVRSSAILPYLSDVLEQIRTRDAASR
jgi:hypothetical protein